MKSPNVNPSAKFTQRRIIIFVTHYRGRIAPSPTGLLHLGHARTFWIAAERAAAGTLLFRNEDLDPQRSNAAFTQAMIEDLTWLGIHWQPPMVTQSTRHELYRVALHRLLQSGEIYPCTCSRKDLAHIIHAPHESEDDEPVYDGHCRPAPNTPNSNALQPNANYRFRVPDGETIRFTDNNLGPQQFTAGKDFADFREAAFGDFLVWRKDDLPSYQLACVVDDADMQITEVVRGCDLLKSTARQLLLYRALGLTAPSFFHTELMRDDAGQRLAKRHDALSLRALRESGLTPEEVRARF